jgi:hypothetical protein
MRLLLTISRTGEACRSPIAMPRDRRKHPAVAAVNETMSTEEHRWVPDRHRVTWDPT